MLTTDNRPVVALLRPWIEILTNQVNIYESATGPILQLTGLIWTTPDAVQLHV